MKLLKHMLYILLPFLAGCSSILGSTAETIVLSSEMEGTYVEVYNDKDFVIEEGFTPLTVNLKKGDGYFLKEHYKIRAYREDGFGCERELTPDISITYFLNLVIPGGFIGMLTVDPYTGSMWTFYQDTIVVDGVD